MFAWTKPPMLPTTTASIDAYLDRVAPDAKERVLAAYPDYPRRRALVAFGSDVMFGGPAWAFADAYSAQAPTHMYRFDHFGWSLRVLGLGATHGSEIVHIQHSYASFIGRKLHPLGRRLQPPVGRRMQRAWLDFAAQGLGHRRNPLVQWATLADLRHRAPLHPHHPVGPRHGGRGSRRRPPQGLGRPVLISAKLYSSRPVLGLSLLEYSFAQSSGVANRLFV